MSRSNRAMWQIQFHVAMRVGFLALLVFTWKQCSFTLHIVDLLQVRTFLVQTLEEITSTWIRGIKYEFSVACPACNDLNQPPEPDVSKYIHLLPLEECLNKVRIMCQKKKRLIPTSIFKKWFQDVAVEEPSEKSERRFILIAIWLYRHIKSWTKRIQKVSKFNT